MIQAKLSFTTAALLLTSCVTVQPYELSLKAIEAEPIEVETIVVQNSDFSESKILTPERFIESGAFKKSNNGTGVILNYRSCEQVFPDGNFWRGVNAILPIITLGFYPHKLIYSCPLDLKITKGSGESKESHYDLKFRTTAGTLELFKSNLPIEEQIYSEKLSQTKLKLNGTEK